MLRCSFKNTMLFCEDLSKYVSKQNLSKFRNLALRQRFVQQSADIIVLEEKDFNDILADLQKNATEKEIMDFVNGDLVTSPYE